MYAVTCIERRNLESVPALRFSSRTEVWRDAASDEREHHQGCFSANIKYMVLRVRVHTNLATGTSTSTSTVPGTLVPVALSPGVAFTRYSIQGVHPFALDAGTDTPANLVTGTTTWYQAPVEEHK